MELMRALSLLENLESRLASVYDRFSQAFRADSDAMRLFADLADDEESHRQVIRYEQRLVRFNPNSFKPLELDLREVDKLVKRCEGILESPEVGLDAALSFAYDVECLSAECHLKHALSETNPELQHLLRKLGRGDEDHVRALKNFIHQRSFGLPPHV